MFSSAVNQSRCSRRYSTSITTIPINILFINMAFVYQSARNLDKPRLSSLPGPGTYAHPHSQPHPEIYAPFCSTTLRSPLHEPAPNPGPGSYELRKNIGQPTITTYTNKSSIVIRVNSEGSAPFTSQLPRFEPSISPGPGPGDYELQRESRLKPKRIVPVRRQIVDPPKNPPSINAKTTYLNRRRAKTEEALKNLKDSLKADKSLKGSVWARDKVSRFKQEASNQVGPGRYTVDCQKKGVVHRSFSVGFASNTVRSFFDTIMYDTTNGRTLESRIQRGYKNKQPGPGAYYNQQPRENDSEQYKNHSFGSSNQRFQKISRDCFDAPFYSTSEPKKRTKTDPQFRSEVKRGFIIPLDQEIPGPGSYEPHFYKIGKILKVQTGNFGSKAKRTSIIGPEGEADVGPGSYDPAIHRLSETVPSSYFSSAVPRFSTNKVQHDTLGQYDLSQSDMSRRALFNRMHRQNLEKINCFKPAFDTKIPRFPHYQEAKVEIKTTAKQLYLSFVEKHEEQRARGIEEARVQVPAKRSTISKSRRFETERGGPGVGEYSLRNNWLKRTYNLKYKTKGK